MKIQTTTQTTNTQEVSNKTKDSPKLEFKLNTYDREYTEDEQQYIKNFTKILMVKDEKLTIEQATQISYNQLNIPDELKNNDKFSYNGIFPAGIAISDEFTNSYIETYNSLSKDNQMQLQFLEMISTKDKNIDLSTDDKRMEHFISVSNNLKELDKNPNTDNSTLINIVDILLKNFENNIEKKDEVNKAILESYTKNTKPNPLSDNLNF